MKTFSQILAVFMLGANLTTAFGQDNSRVLRQVEARLRPVFAGLKPAPTIERPDAEHLLVCYRTRTFLVHHGSMTGEWSTNVFPELGPGVTGFVLRIDVERLGEINQPVTPQTVQEPYWRTFLDVTPVGGTTNQIYWSFSYAGQTDPKVLANIRQALGRLAGQGSKLRTDPGHFP